MAELSENNFQPISQEEVERQIALAEATMSRFSARTIGEVITVAMGKFSDDKEKVVHSLLEQKVFEKTADCPDPEAIARAVVEKYIQHGERLRDTEKPL